MTPKIARFLAEEKPPAPCLVVDLDVLAGPTCDEVDILYDKADYQLPLALKVGDKVVIESAGAYTTTYASVGFNGIPPLRGYYI